MHEKFIPAKYTTIVLIDNLFLGNSLGLSWLFHIIFCMIRIFFSCIFLFLLSGCALIGNNGANISTTS